MNFTKLVKEWPYKSDKATLTEVDRLSVEGHAYGGLDELEAC